MKKGLLRTICSISLIAAIFTTMSISASPILVGINDAALNVKNVTDATRVSSPVNYPSKAKKSIHVPSTENKAIANAVASVFSEGAVVKTGGEPVNTPLACITTNTVTYSYTSGSAVKTFTVPANAGSLITIRAVGAGGGNGPSSAKGGRGADVQGDFTLTPGTQIYIMTGNVGASTAVTTKGGGGGGGTFVTTDPNFKIGLLLAAGGGGGAANGGGAGNASFGSDGRIPLDTLLPSTTYKNAGYAGGPGAVVSGGDGGFQGTGGSAAADVNAGASGAGWNSDGSGLGAGGNANTGGIPPYLSTLLTTSGVPSGTGQKGGFGGGANGGSGIAPFNGGGGGGGYSGGGAGGRFSTSAGTYGGGGGSYNGGANQVNLRGSDPGTSAIIGGVGKVTITYTLITVNPPSIVDI